MVFVSNNGFTQKQTKKNNVIIHLLGTGHFDNGRHSRHFVWLSKSLPSNYPTLAPQNLLEMGGLSVYCPCFTDEESEAPREGYKGRMTTEVRSSVVRKPRAVTVTAALSWWPKTPPESRWLAAEGTQWKRARAGHSQRPG